MAAQDPESLPETAPAGGYLQPEGNAGDSEYPPVPDEKVLSPEDFEALALSGAPSLHIVDVRKAISFEKTELPWGKSLSLVVSVPVNQIILRKTELLSYGSLLVFPMNDEDAALAYSRLLEIGIDPDAIVGVLDGGFEKWRDDGREFVYVDGEGC